MAKVDFEEYIKSEILKEAIQRYLKVAIEACINTGNRIISIERAKGKSINPIEYY